MTLALRLALPALLIIAGAVAPARAQQPVDNCAACHRELDDERLKAPVRLFAADVHRAKGFGCVSCHGGDARAQGAEGMDPARGYIGVPSRQQIPQVCGRCHADAQFMRRYNPALRVDQLAEYRTSVHGQRLLERGDTKVATCASCHTPHAIRPASDPRSSVHALRVVDTCGRCHGDPAYMKAYGIATDQLAQYKRSVHWATLTGKGDLSAPTCNDCHGNHGAAPPGVQWVGNVCAQCHSVQGELFAKSRHAAAFVEMGTPGCATCHSNHEIHPATEAMLGLDSGAVCGTCHEAGDPGGRIAGEMRGLLDRLRRGHEASRNLLLRAERSGMEVSQAQFDLNGAMDALVKARAAVHAFTSAPVKEAVAAGLVVTQRTHARGVRALDELRFRRRGLFASLAVIVAVIVALVLKIREMEA